MLPSNSIEEAVRILKEGGIILYPTDTIWGLGCDPWNQDAVDRIFSLKSRPRNQPLLLLVSSIEELKYYVPTIHPRIETLLSFHERPLTLIHPNPKNLPDHLLADDQSIGIRVVTEGICHDLIKSLGKPITSTAPNIADEPTPTTFGTISSEIIGQVDFVLMSQEMAGKAAVPSVIATYDESGELFFLRT